MDPLRVHEPLSTDPHGRWRGTSSAEVERPDRAEVERILAMYRDGAAGPIAAASTGGQPGGRAKAAGDYYALKDSPRSALGTFDAGRSRRGSRRRSSGAVSARGRGAAPRDHGRGRCSTGVGGGGVAAGPAGARKQLGHLGLGELFQELNREKRIKGTCAARFGRIS